MLESYFTVVNTITSVSSPGQPTETNDDEYQKTREPDTTTHVQFSETFKMKTETEETYG